MVTSFLGCAVNPLASLRQKKVRGDNAKPNNSRGKVSLPPACVLACMAEDRRIKCPPLCLAIGIWSKMGG